MHSYGCTQNVCPREQDPLLRNGVGAEKDDVAFLEHWRQEGTMVGLVVIVVHFLVECSIVVGLHLCRYLCQWQWCTIACIVLPICTAVSCRCHDFHVRTGCSGLRRGPLSTGTLLTVCSLHKLLDVQIPQRAHTWHWMEWVFKDVSFARQLTPCKAS